MTLITTVNENEKYAKLPSRLNYGYIYIKADITMKTVKQSRRGKEYQSRFSALIRADEYLNSHKWEYKAESKWEIPKDDLAMPIPVLSSSKTDGQHRSVYYGIRSKGVLKNSSFVRTDLVILKDKNLMWIGKKWDGSSLTADDPIFRTPNHKKNKWYMQDFPDNLLRIVEIKFQYENGKSDEWGKSQERNYLRILRGKSKNLIRMNAKDLGLTLLHISSSEGRKTHETATELAPVFTQEPNRNGAFRWEKWANAPATSKAGDQNLTPLLSPQKQSQLEYSPETLKLFQDIPWLNGKKGSFHATQDILFWQNEDNDTSKPLADKQSMLKALKYLQQESDLDALTLVSAEKIETKVLIRGEDVLMLIIEIAIVGTVFVFLAPIIVEMLPAVLSLLAMAARAPQLGLNIVRSGSVVAAGLGLWSSANAETIDFTDEEIEEAVEKKIELLHQFDLGYTLFHFKEGIPVVEGNTYTIDQVAYIRDASKEEYDASPHVTIVGCDGEIITSKEEARNSCAAERKISF